MSNSALRLSGIRKSFFGVEVLHGIDLFFEPGSIHGLVGENGAGKSTLMNVIGGVLTPDEGHMEINGQPYAPSTPNDAKANHIAFIHQELNLFSNLSIAENLFIDDIPKNRFGANDYAAMRRMASEQLKSFGVTADPSTIVGTLPMGVCQTIEIAKALISDAEILLFDEPTTSLSQQEKDHLFQTIRLLKEKGVAIVFISHILEDVLALCDTISIIRDGNLVRGNGPRNVSRDELISLMVGRKLEKVFPSVEKEIGEKIIEVKDLTAEPRVRGISFSLHKGEILGVFGLMGAGRTELVRAIYGVDKLDSGEIYLEGKRYDRPNPIRSIAQGIAFITEDRRGEGLLMPKSVEKNIILAKMNELTNGIGVIDARQVDLLTDRTIQEMSIKVSDKRLQAAENLSGGNQQKLVIGRWLLKEPKLLLMDEPTRGVDIGAKYEIYTLILELAKKQSGVLFVSSEMEELMGMCDRILVICQGRVAGELKKEDFDQETIMRLALEGGDHNGK